MLGQAVSHYRIVEKLGGGGGRAARLPCIPDTDLVWPMDVDSDG
jgi:hypothetical protein